MKSFDLNVELRKQTGKKSSVELRANGMIPCVLYGGQDIVHFAAKKNELKRILYTPHIYCINIILDGKKHLSFLQDSQFHPVTDEPLHIDFIEVWEDKPAIISLPIVITGSSEGVKAGGKLRQRRRYLKVKGLLKEIPETLEIDVTALRIGEHISVGDLKYPNLELLDPAKSMVVGVSTSRIAKGMEETEMGVVAPAEGEAEGDAAAAADKGEGA
jgi:large subunit ribosomal protein L25